MYLFNLGLSKQLLNECMKSTHESLNIEKSLLLVSDQERLKPVTQQ